MLANSVSAYFFFREEFLSVTPSLPLTEVIGSQWSAFPLLQDSLFTLLFVVTHDEGHAVVRVDVFFSLFFIFLFSRP